MMMIVYLSLSIVSKVVTQLDWPNLAAHMCSRRTRVLGGSKSLYHNIPFFYDNLPAQPCCVGCGCSLSRELPLFIKKETLRVIVPISVSDSVWTIVGSLVLNQSGCQSLSDFSKLRSSWYPKHLWALLRWISGRHLR